MKPDTDTEHDDREFEWDMTAVMMLVMLIVFLLVVAMSFGPLGHTS